MMLKNYPQNQDYAHDTTALLEYLDWSGCSIRENDCSVKIF